MKAGGCRGQSQPLLHSEFKVTLGYHPREAEEASRQAKQAVRQPGPPRSGSWLWDKGQRASILPVLVLQFCNELSLLFVGIKVEAGISGRASLQWGKVFCFVLLVFSKFMYPQSETDC